MAKAANSIQDALRVFADKIGGRDVFDEASIALDAGLDYKLTIICTEKDSGYVVAMHRANVNRLNCWNFTKLGHGEWIDAPGTQGDGGTGGVPASSEPEPKGGA